MVVLGDGAISYERGNRVGSTNMSCAEAWAQCMDIERERERERERGRERERESVCVCERERE